MNACADEERKEGEKRFLSCNKDFMTGNGNGFSIFSNSTGNYSVTYINQTRKINVGGILIEYEGEDSGIGLLFASKAAIQVSIA